VSIVAINLCVASQRVISKVSLYFIIDSVRKLLDIPSYSWMIVWATDWTSLQDLECSIEGVLSGDLGKKYQ
jgi:hypothetical protein